MKQFKATVFGEPVSQPRHRVAARRTKGGRVIVGRYLAKTKDGSAHPVVEWKARIRDAAQKWIADGNTIFQKPTALELCAHFIFTRPASMPKKFGNKHFKKPDLDNLIKAAKDAMSGVIYEDDSQISFMIASKIYSGFSSNQPPHMEITVNAWE